MINRKEESFNRSLGLRLMVLRQSQKISQEELGVSIGVSGQQIQKYEHGINRITPEKLALCANILNVPVGYFYGENEEAGLKQYSKNILITASEIDTLPDDIRRAIQHLIRMIDKIMQQVSNDNQNNGTE